jgi:hypothetical protein
MITQAPAAGRKAHACGRRERALVLPAIGLIALHVVDDSFVQPQPGTSAADHLVSGLVPLAALACGGPGGWTNGCRAGTGAERSSASPV